MSRLGKLPIKLPGGVQVSLNGLEATFKGPKGELKVTINPQTEVKQETIEGSGDALIVTLLNENNGAIWGTMRALLQNMVEGVVTGWSKKLELNGVGFKMNLDGAVLVMSLGFSHEVRYALPEGINASLEGLVLTIAGIDKQLVGKVASEIRSLKKPEPYKGKGFRYTDEVIRRKVGKAAKSD